MSESLSLPSSNWSGARFGLPTQTGWRPDIRQHGKDRLNQARIGEQALMTTRFKVQQLTVEPSLVYHLRLAGRHNDVVRGMHHQTRDRQIITLDIEMGSRNSCTALDQTDEMGSSTSRKSHEVGEAAQRTKDTTRCRNGDQSPGVQSHLSRQQRTSSPIE